MQAYSNPKRANDPYALPDVEIFYHSHSGGTPVKEIAAAAVNCGVGVGSARKKD